MQPRGSRFCLFVRGITFFDDGLARTLLHRLKVNQSNLQFSDVPLCPKVETPLQAFERSGMASSVLPLSVVPLSILARSEVEVDGNLKLLQIAEETMTLNCYEKSALASLDNT